MTTDRLSRRLVGLDRTERAQGMLIGHLVGDALGSPYEFSAGTRSTEWIPVLGRGVFGHPAGTGTDDTAMLRACAETLIANGDFDTADYAARLIAWYETRPPDVGAQTGQAIRRWIATGAGPTLDEKAQGNGALMAAAPLAFLGERANNAARIQCGATHPSPHNEREVAGYVTELARILDTGSWAWAGDIIVPGTWDPASAEMGWVTGTRSLARRALAATLGPDAVTPLEALYAVIRQGGDTDTNGAVAGAMLGTFWGPSVFTEIADQLDPVERATNLTLAEGLATL